MKKRKGEKIKDETVFRDIMDADTLPDVLQKLPGVYVSNSSGLSPHLNLRGTRVGMSEGALVLLNGIPMSMGKFGYVEWDAVPVENIQRVEVVKGPLSSLYGGDAARGVINIITKRSSEKMKGKMSATFGEDDDQRYSALIYGGNQKFDYNLNVKKKEADSYRDDIGVDNWNYTADLGWCVNDTSRLGFFVNVSDAETYLPKKMTVDQREEDPRSIVIRRPDRPGRPGWHLNSDDLVSATHYRFRSMSNMFPDNMPVPASRI